MNEGSYHCAPVVMTGQGDTRMAWVPSREQPGKLRPTPAPGETLDYDRAGEGAERLVWIV